MILWISGHPKNGNTLTQIFLSNYIFDKNSDLFHNLKYIGDFPTNFNFIS